MFKYLVFESHQIQYGCWLSEIMKLESV